MLGGRARLHKQVLAICAIGVRRLRPSPEGRREVSKQCKQPPCTRAASPHGTGQGFVLHGPALHEKGRLRKISRQEAPYDGGAVPSHHSPYVRFHCSTLAPRGTRGDRTFAAVTGNVSPANGLPLVDEAVDPPCDLLYSRNPRIIADQAERADGLSVQPQDQ